MILIIDFSSQYTQLIARRIRENNVYCEIKTFDISIEKISSYKPDGIILSGGPYSVSGDVYPYIDPEIFKLNIPVLGICYGMQLMVDILGGSVISSNKSEFGHSLMIIQDQDTLFEREGLTSVWMSHNDRVDELPDGFEILATHAEDSTMIAAICNKKSKLYGLQFHPEVTHTEFGKSIISNFIFKICNCCPSWKIDSFLDTKINQLKHQIGSDNVLCALSGGIDSLVTAMILQKAIGDQLICVFVNTGLLRKNEATIIEKTFTSKYNLKLITINAENQFLTTLQNIIDPESKRRQIGRLFIEIFEKEAAKLKDIKYLAQGTIYPDVIESKIIKSHHNVGGLPDNMNLSLIEPLNELFKDEVRELGKLLNIDDLIINQHPFPGPGLAIRIPGQVTKIDLDILRDADEILIDELKKNNLYTDIWQAFAVLLPVSSVGVMGDCRTYGKTISIRCVTSIDAMTADWAKIPYETLSKISNRIINEVKFVNRVLYDITSKPPGTIEWE